MSKRTKITYLITGLNTGGAEVLLRDMAERINTNQFEATIVSILPLGEIGKGIKESGRCKVVSLNTKFKYSPLILFKLFQALKKEDPDILHTHLFHADILGRVVGKLVGVPTVISTIHNVNIGGRIREWLLRLTRSLVDVNIAVSNMVAREAVKNGVAISGKTKVVYNGINFENFPEQNKRELRVKLNLPEEKDIFISVGSLTRQKGYIYLVEAVKSLQRDCLFVILGDGPEREKIEKKIEKHELEDKILLQGNVNNVNDYLQAADFFVMPSLWEGFSVALLEAAITGKIVIATDVGGNSEIIENSENGFLIEPENVSELLRKIDHVLDLPGKRRSVLAKNLKESVRKKFSIENMVQSYEKIYHSMSKNEA